MIALVAILVTVVAFLIDTIALTAAGFRDGDRPGDVHVTAVPGSVPHPEGRQRIVTTTVRNPGDLPVLVGPSVRRSHMPAVLAPQMTVTVPFRTRAPRYRADRQATVGVVGAGETARWSLPAPPGRRARLVAVAGQSARRLRVVTLPVPLDQPAVPVPSPAPRPSRLDDQHRR